MLVKFTPGFWGSKKQCISKVASRLKLKNTIIWIFVEIFVFRVEILKFEIINLADK